MAQKVTKRQLKQDQFAQSIYVVWAYARENPLVSLGAVVGLIAVVTLAVRIGGSVAGPDRGGDPEAEQALMAARGEFSQGRLDTGAEALREVKRRHGSSRAAREASFLLGNSLYELGDYAGAQNAFEEFLEDPLYGELLRDGALLAIAACKEESGNLAGASEDYDHLWNSGDSPGARIQAALAGARVARAQGRDDRARDFYQRLVDTFPGTPEADDARFALLELAAG